MKPGDQVWHCTDGDTPGIITGILTRLGGIVLYEVRWTPEGEPMLHAFEELHTLDDRPKWSRGDPHEPHGLA